MKNLLYISELTDEKSLNNSLKSISTIWHHSRKSNSEQQITGVLVYKNRHFLQILEGPDKNVDALMGKIQKDTRHSNIVVIFENSTNERIFSQWAMRLLASCNDTKLIDFISECIQNSPKLLKQHQKLLEQFYDFPNHQNIKDDLQDFSDFNIKLLAWPNFSNLKPSIALIDLCSLIVNSYQSYKEVLLQHSFKDKKELDEMLSYLYKHGALDLQINKSNSNVQKLQPKGTGQNNFYQKMKVFLNKQI